MNLTGDPDTTISAWLDEGPRTLPQTTRRAIHVTSLNTHQARRRWLRPLRAPNVNRLMRPTLALATVLIVAVSGLFLVNRGPSWPATGSATATASPAGAVVARYGEIHVGWVYIYADGRVVLSQDGAAQFERRLTATALDEVRSGRIEAASILASGLMELARLHRALPLSAKDWAEPTWRPFEPLTFAVCYQVDERPVPASDAVRLLPAAAQAMLRGKDRTYRGEIIPFTMPTPAKSGGSTDGLQGQAEHCSELAPADVGPLGEALGGWTWTNGLTTSAQVLVTAPGRPPFCACPGPSTPTSIVITLAVDSCPVMPHGACVPWAG